MCELQHKLRIKQADYPFRLYSHLCASCNTKAGLDVEQVGYIHTYVQVATTILLRYRYPDCGYIYTYVRVATALH